MTVCVWRQRWTWMGIHKIKQVVNNNNNHPLARPVTPLPGRLHRNLGLALFERPRAPINRFPNQNSVNHLPIPRFPNFPSTTAHTHPDNFELSPVHRDSFNNPDLTREEAPVITAPSKRPFFPNDQRTIVETQEKLPEQPIRVPVKQAIITSTTDIDNEEHEENMEDEDNKQVKKPRPMKILRSSWHNESPNKLNVY